MRIPGKIWKNNGFWLIEVPALDLMTQGKSKKDAFKMLKDAIQSLQEKSKFTIKIGDKQHDSFYVSSPQIKELTAFILFRLRTKSGQSLEDVRIKLGVKSKNAYAQYEQGRAEPTLSKMEELLKALDSDLILNAA